MVKVKKYGDFLFLGEIIFFFFWGVIEFEVVKLYIDFFFFIFIEVFYGVFFGFVLMINVVIYGDEFNGVEIIC